MANTVIDNNAEEDMPQRSLQALVWVDDQVGYQFVIDDTSFDLHYRKTSNAGVSWGARVDIETGITCENVTVWYDRWTAGDNGTRIHIAWANSAAETILYNYLDTADDSLGTAVTVFTCTLIDPVSMNAGGGIGIVKARGGNLYIEGATDNSAAGNLLHVRSVDGGVNWTNRSTSMFETSFGNWAADWRLPVPGDESDPNDYWVFYLDVSASAWSIKVYDDSANTWAETAGASIPGGEASPLSNTEHQWEVVQKEDGTCFLVVMALSGLNPDDFLVWQIDGLGSYTQRTNVITNDATAMSPSLHIDENTGRIYCNLFRDVAGNNRYSEYYYSDDNGVTWNGPTTYIEVVTVSNLMYGSWSGYKTREGDSGRFQPTQLNRSVNDLLTNVGNSVALFPLDPATITVGPTVSYGSLTRTGPNNTPWRLTFTAFDEDHTGADDLTWELWTGAGQTGTLIATGTCTHLVSEVADIAYNTAGLVEGSNSLQLSIDNGNVFSIDYAVTVLRDDTAPSAISAVTVSP